MSGEAFSGRPEKGAGLADLGGEPVTDRCRRCFKQMLADIGPSVYGHGQVLTYCVNCGVQPEEVGWEATLTAAVAVVRGRRSE